MKKFIFCFLITINAFAVDKVETVTCTGISKTHGVIMVTYENRGFQIDGKEVLGRTVIEKLSEGKLTELKTFYDHSLGTGSYHQTLVQHLVKENDQFGRDLRLELYLFRMVNKQFSGYFSFSLDGTPIHPNTHERFSIECTFEEIESTSKAGPSLLPQ